MTNLNDYFSEETVEMMLSNIEVIVGDFECMDDVVLPETWIRLFMQVLVQIILVMMMNLKSKCSRYC